MDPGKNLYERSKFGKEYNFIPCSCVSSYLNTLLVPINAVTTKLIEELKPLADGVTQVPMKLRFGDFTNEGKCTS